MSIIVKCSSFLLALLLLVRPTVGETADDFLRIHNYYRGLVRQGFVPNQPQAAEMPDLVYSQKLENEALQWAKKCIFEHEPDQVTGENLAISSDEEDEMIAEWYAEYKYFTFGMITPTSSPKYLHYTQLVWANTEEVGCVKHLCSEIKWDDRTYEDIYYTVCKYFPSGNYAEEYPYTTV